MRGDEERAGLPHGGVCYLQIPATDPLASAAFYRRVFDWDAEEGGFEAPGLIGQWVTDGEPAEGGILIWISVNDIAAALAGGREAGGAALEEPYADGPDRLLASLRDPGGNTLGIVQHGLSAAG